MRKDGSVHCISLVSAPACNITDINTYVQKTSGHQEIKKKLMISRSMFHCFSINRLISEKKNRIQIARDFLRILHEEGKMYHKNCK